ncbi:MAG: dienelactone hydrolase family protein [Caldilineaceae bacterium]|nr:dienelactone hydrolase family protein [Caldilineaceae bacterium]
MQNAALLAGHGYAALAVAYANVPGLPESNGGRRIPVDTVEMGIRWLQANPAIDSARIAVLGVSMGGELALLAGSLLPELDAVVSLNGSPIVWVRDNLASRGQVDGPVWAYRGEDLPYAFLPIPADYPYRRLTGETLEFTPVYLTALEDWASVEPAMTRVEKTNGPILLLTGGDDRTWPSARLAEIVVARLDEYNFPYPYRHVNYPSGGHSLGRPYLPTYTTINSLVDCDQALGGSPAANAAMTVAAWQEVFAFLDAAFADGL